MGIQSNNKQNCLKREKTAGDQHVDGFSFALDGMAGWCNFFRLIVEGSKNFSWLVENFSSRIYKMLSAENF